MSSFQRRSRFGLAVIVCGLSALLSNAAFGQGWPQLPAEARQTLAQAERLTEQAFTLGAADMPLVRRRKMSEAARSFASALDRLGAQVGAARCEQFRTAEGNDIEAKLVAIACDMKSRKPLYPEIERVYIKGVHLPQAELPRSPYLKPIHVDERYRLPWEFFLLTPDVEGSSPLYDFRVTEALGRIHNNASIVTLLYAYRITTLKGVDRRAIEDRQRLILQSLNFFASEQSLRALLECLTLSQQQPGGPAWDVRDYVYRLLSDQENYGNGEQWRKVITAFPKAGLPPNQRELLERALNALKNSRR